MKQLMKLLKIEGTLALRCPDGILFGIFMPVAILFLIGFVANGQMMEGSPEPIFDRSVPALFTVGICATAFMGIPATLADYRDKKILKHFFVTPMGPGLILLVEGMIALLTAVCSALLVAGCATIFFHYHMEGNILFFLLGYLLVLSSMYSIAMIIAALCPNVRVSNIVSTIVYFPMLFLSGATIPFELFPSFLQTLANMLPLTFGVKLLKNLSFGIFDSTCMLAVFALIVMMIASMLITHKVFRWE